MQGKRKRTVSLLLLKKWPNKVSASKPRNPYDANGIRRNSQPLKLPVFCWLKAALVSHLWVSARQQSSGGFLVSLSGSGGIPRMAQTVTETDLSSPLLSLHHGASHCSPMHSSKADFPTCIVLHVKMQIIIVALSEKCNYNDGSPANYTYKWHKQHAQRKGDGAGKKFFLRSHICS